MKLFKIVKDNKKSLRERSTNVEFPLSDEIKQTLRDMLTYLNASQDEEFLKKHPDIRSGVGLAAPQIGINKNMVAISYDDEKGKHHEMLLINPRIVSESIKQCALEGGEGCLSVDKEHQGYVYRAYKIVVKAYDLLKEENVEYTLQGFGAIVTQHEIDHLKGILFYDHINKQNPFEKKPGAIIL